jgi:hypothetical protein
MESGHQDGDPMERAARYIAAHGRSYRSHKGKRVTLQIFTKQVRKLEEVRRLFGGNYYRHLSGFIWAVSKKDVLIQVARAVQPVVVDGHRLGVLLEYLEVHDAPVGHGNSEKGDSLPPSPDTDVSKG